MDEHKILIIGAAGQLGIALQTRYPAAKAASSDELDISDPAAVAAFDWSGVEVVINAAAYTNVDGAETAEGRIAAWQVNALGATNLTRASLEHSLTLVHISTDYVFDGTQPSIPKQKPFHRLVFTARTKAAGDLAVSLVPKHYILRTSWVIGEGKNFVRTMLGLGQKSIAPTVVADQVGRLTFTSELVRAIDHILSNQVASGIYNATNGGEPASWADITRTIFEFGNYDLTVTDTTTAEYFAGKPGTAPRPLNSSLALDKIQAAGFTPTDWRTDLKTYVDKELQQV